MTASGESRAQSPRGGVPSEDSVVGRADPQEATDKAGSKVPGDVPPAPSGDAARLVSERSLPEGFVPPVTLSGDAEHLYVVDGEGRILSTFRQVGWRSKVTGDICECPIYERSPHANSEAVYVIDRGHSGRSEGASDG